jgi:hypothetical protein
MKPSLDCIMFAVWMHTVHCDFRNKGWPAQTDEYNEAIDTFRRAESAGMRIPSIAEACDYYNGM